MFPCFAPQALDEEYLKVDAQFGGIDQRKIFTFAEKVSILLPIFFSLEPQSYAVKSYGKCQSHHSQSYCIV